ncbi:MAG: efflux RND transporter periplasmic adaptor subunit [Bacillota bacterium]|nr:efflux RND transporter periplasmic adaptor subunit [Bacillota bacterium]
METGRKPMKSPWIRVLLIALLAVVIVGIYWARGHQEPQALQVETHQVTPGVFVEEVQASGQIGALQPADVMAPFSAPIEKVLVREGDAVEKGQLLVVMDTTSIREQLLQARAQVDQAQSQLAKLQKQAPDQDKLNKLQIQAAEERIQIAKDNLDALPPLPEYDTQRKEAYRQWQQAQQDLEQLKIQLDMQKVQPEDVAAARASLTAAQENLRQLEDLLQKAEIRAPISGTILNLSGAAGASVPAGTPLLTVAGLDPIALLAQVDENDRGTLRLGQPASVTVQAYPGEIFSGEVTSISPAAQRQADMAVFIVEIQVDNGDGLLFPGMSGRVAIQTRKEANVLTIPYQALTARQGQAGVFRVEGGTARFVPIVLGAQTATEAVVKEGLKAGDQVITGPPDVLPKLQDGTAVQVSTQGS